MIGLFCADFPGVSERETKKDLAIDERKVFILPSGGESGTEMLAVRHQSQEHAQ